MNVKIKELIQQLAGVFGYQIFSTRRFPIDMDKEFKSVYQECKKYTQTSIERMYALYKATQYIVNSKILGDFVECGVWKGGSTMIMAKTLLKMDDTKRKIYLYDTFAGMPKPSKKDKRLYDSLEFYEIWKRKQKKGYNEFNYSPLSEVKKNMFSTKYPPKNLIFVKGRVEDRIPSSAPSKIALLRLDTDWYESTYHELVHLYPLLSQGGVLIIDDYGYCSGSKEAVDKYFNKNRKILLNRIDIPGRLGIKLTK